MSVHVVRGSTIRRRLAGLVAAMAWAVAPAVARETPATAAAASPGAIAFGRQTGTFVQIWTVAPDGSNLTQLTTEGRNADPEWSPDGSTIAFVSDRNADSPGYGDTDVYLMNPDGTNVRRLTTTPTATEGNPTWSPDGTKLAFQRYSNDNYDIWTMNVDGTGQVNVTNHPREDIEPVWSPVAATIAFRSDRTGNMDIFTMSPDGSGLVDLTASATNEGEPAWSPDGTRLAYNSGGGIATISIRVLATGAVTALSGIDRTGPFGWSPDGRRLVIGIHADDLYRVDPQDCIEPVRFTRFTDTGTYGSIASVDWRRTSAPIDPTGEFRSLTPSRVLDTRDGTGLRLGALAEEESIDVQITGVGGVPLTGAAAVVLNATVTEPTVASYLTVWPTGAPRPLASNLNVVAGQTVPNLVIVGIGAGGRVSVFNFRGSAHVVLDVFGYYTSAVGTAGARFHGITPTRLFDTRDGLGGVPVGAVGAGQELRVNVACTAGLPSAGLSAIVMNVTVTGPTTGGFLTVYPGDVDRPLASNLNFVPGLTVPNLTVMRVPPSGVVAFYNSSGSTHVVADVVGYYDDDRVTDVGRFVPLAPTRLADTRRGSGALGPRGVGVLSVSGRGGVPASGVASVVLNTTVTETTASGFLTVLPDDACNLPLASNLNFVAGQTVPNLVIVKVSTSGGCAVEAGAVDFFNSAGYTHVVVDLFGYFTA